MRRTKLTVLALAGLALAVGAGCGGDDNNNDSGSSGDSGGKKDPIVIGESMGKSGFLTAYDIPPSEGAHIAADEINAQGGIEGRKIIFKQMDNQSDPNQSFTAAKSLVDGGADILLGSCNFEQAAPTARVANEEGKLFFSYCGGEPRLTQQAGDRNTLTFDMGNETNGVGATMAKFADSKGFKRVYTLTDTTNDYSQQMCKFFKSSLATYPGTSIAGEDTFKNDDASVASQITRMKAAGNLDAIVICSYLPGAATALRQIRAAGLDVPVLTGDGMDSASLFDAVKNLNDFYMVAGASVYGDDPDQAVQDLVDKYKTKTGEDPDGSYVVFGYSIIQALKAAIEKTGGDVDGAKLRDALESLRKEPLLVGPITYTKEQHVDAFRPEKIIQVQNGKPSYLTTVELDEVPNPFGSGFLKNPSAE